MKALLKILIGTIFVIGGIYWYFVTLSLGTGLMNWQAFILLFKGFFGVFIFLLGIFIVWLEADELKTKKEERKEKVKVPKQIQAEEIKKAVGETPEKKNKYICPTCGKEFKTERGLKIHRVRSH